MKSIFIILGKKINLSELEKVFYGKCIPKFVKFRENIVSTSNELFIMSWKNMI